jgi:hypothetical protein
VKTVRFRKHAAGEQEHRLSFAEIGCADALESYSDVDVSLHIFKKWRQLDQLQFLTCAALDFDVAHTSAGTEVDIQNIEHHIQITLDACSKIEGDGIRLDAPNLIVRTGRGFHLYWLFDALLPAQALTRWARVQEYLIKKIAENGGAQADVNAIDATRVLRLVGTVNSKATYEQQPWRVKAQVLNRNRIDFESLARCVLPLTRAEVLEWRAKKQAKTAKAAAAIKSSNVAGGTAIGFAVQNQIDRAAQQYDWIVTQIREKFDGVVPKNGKCRNTVLFAAASMLAWLVAPQDLSSTVHAFARAHIEGMSESEVIKSRVSTVIKRALDSAKNEAQAHPYDDQRYVFSSKKGGWLDRNLTPVFDSPSAKLALYGLQKPAKTNNDYSKVGVRKSNLVSAIRAHDLRAKNATLRDIAAELNVSAKTVKKWLDIRLEILHAQRHENVIALPTLPASAPPPPAPLPEVTVQSPSFLMTPLSDKPPSFEPVARLLPKNSINGFSPSFIAVLQQPLSGGGSGGEPRPVDNLKELNEIPVIEGLKAIVQGLFAKEDREYRPKNPLSKRYFITSDENATVVQLIVTEKLWFNPVIRVGGAGLLTAAEQLFDKDRKTSIAKLIEAGLLPDLRRSTTKKETKLNEHQRQSTPPKTDSPPPKPKNAP